MKELKCKKIITVAVIFVMMLSFTACDYNTTWPLKENGYFMVYEYGAGHLMEVINLSEIGLQQKVIIFPEKISGKKYQISDTRGGLAMRSVYFTENSTLEKAYFEYDIYIDSTAENMFEKCHNMKKVISVFTYGVDIQINKNKTLFLYLNKRDYFNYDEQQIYYRLADIQCIYNYEGATNDGYFWIDDIENGEKIEIMPDTPVREGYTFNGWYKEAACENKWDFETDTVTKQEISENEKYPDNYVTYLYAKWIKN